jgi:AcrR family transcriptional regulator
MAGPADQALQVPSAHTKSERRIEIRTAALRVFATKGFDSATMREIATAVGTRAGSLYHHFRSKDELLFELLSEYYEQGLEQTRSMVSQDKDAGILLRESCKALLRYVLHRPLETLIVFNDYRALSEISEFDFIMRDAMRVEKLWIDLISRAIAEGYVRSDINPVIVYRTIAGAIFTVVRWLPEEKSISVEEIVEHQTRMFLDGILAARSS